MEKIIYKLKTPQLHFKMAFPSMNIKPYPLK